MGTANKERWADIVENSDDELEDLRLPWLEIPETKNSDEDVAGQDKARPSWAQVVAEETGVTWDNTREQITTRAIRTYSDTVRTVTGFTEGTNVVHRGTNSVGNTIARKDATWAQIVALSVPDEQTDVHPGAKLISNTDQVTESKAVIRDEEGDPIGIRAVQSILMSATQSNLSHFHIAGMDIADIIAGVKPSAAEAMDSVYTKHNTCMVFKISADMEARDIKRHIVGASLGSFVITVGSSFTVIPERENVWYEVLGKPMHDNILRLYIDYKKMWNHGLTLEILAQKAFGNDCLWNVSPDFMGMIDINISGVYMSSWLSRMKWVVCGTPNIISCNVESGNAVTRGTDILTVSRTPGVDKRTVVCNNISEVEKMFGIEAAAHMLSGLVRSYIVSDFMTRTGTTLSFYKRNREIQGKGLLTSMGFERPKDDIKDAVMSNNKSTHVSTYESIMTGIDPSLGFNIITLSDN